MNRPDSAILGLIRYALDRRLIETYDVAYATNGLDQTAVEGVTDQAENGGLGTVHENTSEKKSKFHTEI